MNRNYLKYKRGSPRKYYIDICTLEEDDDGFYGYGDLKLRGYPYELVKAIKVRISRDDAMNIINFIDQAAK